MAEKKTGFDFDGWTWAHYVCEITPPEMLSMKARLALLILARHCNPTHQCFIGLDRLARMMGASENSAREALKELEKPAPIHPLITRTKRNGTSAVIFLHVWANDLRVPPLRDDGKMDDTAPVAPDWAIEEFGNDHPFLRFINSNKGKRTKRWSQLENELLSTTSAEVRANIAHGRVMLLASDDEREEWESDGIPEDLLELAAMPSRHIAAHCLGAANEQEAQLLLFQ